MADMERTRDAPALVNRTITSRLQRLVKKLRLRVLHSRKDAVGDWEMAINRFAAGLMVVLFNLVWPSVYLKAAPGQLIAPLLYVVLGLVVLAHCIAIPSAVLGRRSLAMALDFAAVSYEIHIGGLNTAWLYPAYLWVIFGNGFRFGEKFLIIATSISAASFALTIFITPFWRAQPPLSAGLFVGMIIVPLYSITLIRKLSEARRRAEVASQAKSSFLASVSHELRTPLNAIVGTGALLEAAAEDAEQQEMSRTVMNAARALLSLIDGILDLSRIEAGKMPVVANDFDLAELLGQTHRMMMTQAQAKDLSLTLHVAARTPLRLYGDDRRLREILLNLIANAIKFTQQGGVTIAVDRATTDGSGDRLRFEVTDSGIGIDPEALDRIFETFEQANSKILDNYGGTGLGLAITRKLVLLLNGRIGVESVVGSGSTFWFEMDFPSERMPIAQSERFQGLQAVLLSKNPRAVSALVARLSDWRVPIRAATQAEAAALDQLYNPEDTLGILSLQLKASERPSGSDALLVELAMSSSHGFPRTQRERRFVSTLSPSFSDEELMTVLSVALATGSNAATVGHELVQASLKNPELRILVADDNRMNQLVMTKILQKAGHKVKVVGDGGAALDALTDEEFDVAIMDVNMPVMDGINVVQNYRFGAIGDERLPILGLTADATLGTKERCLAAGMDASITKPIEPAALLASIDDVVSRIRPKAPKPAEVSNRVTAISSHPRFGEHSTPSFDRKMIIHLNDLAGPEFVQEVIDSYLVESRASIESLRQAFRSADVESFRFSAHALRSGAANLGVMRLFEICGDLETISARDLGEMGSTHLRRLSAELAVVEDALMNWESKGMAKQ
jgi:two-component system sensor histidine kinase RpfC